MKITTGGYNRPRILRSNPLSSNHHNFELDIFFYILKNYYYPELEKLKEKKN